MITLSDDQKDAIRRDFTTSAHYARWFRSKDATAHNSDVLCEIAVTAYAVLSKTMRRANSKRGAEDFAATLAFLVMDGQVTIAASD